MDQPTVTSTSFGAVTGLAITIEVALLVYALSLFVPLLVNGSVTRFRLKYARWSIKHYTGVVLSEDALAVVYGRRVTGYTETGDRIDRTYTTTDIHNTVILQLADGSYHQVNLVNFGGRPIPGQVSTVWYGVHGRKWIPLLLVNDATNQWFWPDRKRGVNRVVTWHVHLAVIGIVLGLMFAIFGGGAGIGLCFLSLVAFIAGARFTEWKFHHGGLKPLVRVSQQEARELSDAGG